jgi:hypothetical protein
MPSKSFFTYRFLLLFLLSFSTLNAQEPTFPKTNNISKLSYKIIELVDHTYGYDIYNTEKLMIHQPSVPGIQGNKGFKTKADAERVAKLMISKIKKGEMPPTVTTDELKKLNVTF